jgi:glutaredoxin
MNTVSPPFRADARERPSRLSSVNPLIFRRVRGLPRAQHVEHALVLTLYQAEWCPYSSAVRERLTELGIDFVAKQVAARQEERDGEHEIPLLVTDDGERFEGTDAVFEYLGALAPGESEREHRAQYRAHRADRAYEKTTRVLTEKAPLRAVTPVESEPLAPR